jgi:hypothetical protein
LSQAKRELERRNQEAPHVDANLTEWQVESVLKLVECAHCDEDIEPDEHALHGDNDQWLHLGCWDGHVGYLAAMGKDD